MSLNSTAGDAAAESYFAIGDADTYFTARGNTTWTGSATVKEAAARVGTQYLENAYRGRWRGLTSTQAQALSWPRSDGYRDIYRSFTFPLQGPEGFALDQTTVPVQVQRAAMEAALLSLTGSTLEPTLVRGGAVQSFKNTVDVISEEVTYANGAPVIDRYLVIEGLLRGLVTNTPGAPSGNVRLARS